MIVSIHQPQFFPWLGYFDKIAKSDVFVFLDDVQYKKNEWQNRNKIKTSQGEQWLTVPVLYHFPEKIIEVKINNQIDWKKNHLHSFTSNYSKAKYFHEIFDSFSEIYDRGWSNLVDLNLATIQKSIDFLGIKTQLLKSSQMNIEGSSTERLVAICKYLKADTYIAGQGGKDYVDESLFNATNIKLVFQDFSHPVYTQCFGDFLPNLSIIDLLFNCGSESNKVFSDKKFSSHGFI